MLTSQRIEEFMLIAQITSDKMLRPIKENDTRWLSTYLMLIRAIELKSSIDLFAFRHRESVRGEKNLGDCQMSSKDQNYCKEVVGFLQKFYYLVKDLEGKDDSGKLNLRTLSQDSLKLRTLLIRIGNFGYVQEILLAYDLMKQHITKWIQQFNSNQFLDIEDPEKERAMLQTNALNAEAKLLKYHRLLDSLVYIVAVVLVLQNK